jgi:hypothetical protein
MLSICLCEKCHEKVHLPEYLCQGKVSHTSLFQCQDLFIVQPRIIKKRPFCQDISKCQGNAYFSFYEFKGKNTCVCVCHGHGKAIRQNTVSMSTCQSKAYSSLYCINAKRKGCLCVFLSMSWKGHTSKY